MTETMSASEFWLWHEEFRRNPWDENRADLRAGTITTAIINYAGKTLASSATPAQPGDFMRFPLKDESDEEEPTSGDDVKRFFQSL